MQTGIVSYSHLVIMLFLNLSFRISYTPSVLLWFVGSFQSISRPTVLILRFLSACSTLLSDLQAQTDILLLGAIDRLSHFQNKNYRSMDLPAESHSVNSLLMCVPYSSKLSARRIPCSALSVAKKKGFGIEEKEKRRRITCDTPLLLLHDLTNLVQIVFCILHNLIVIFDVFGLCGIFYFPSALQIALPKISSLSSPIHSSLLAPAQWTV